MVDVTAKPVTQRVAVARGFVSLSKETLDLVQEGQIPKGDVLAAARIAGIMAAKQVHTLIPLCHPLLITGAQVAFEAQQHPAVGLAIESRVKTAGQTGAEMEALTAVAAAALTIYDMCKAVDRGMVVGDIRLVYKAGGRSGTYRRPGESPPARQA
jgi:cyclic pyranopterin monophosphate synthase